mgnify:CR=1 FL=1
MTERSEVHKPALLVEPIGHPVDAMVSVPGSKSLTNRALLCAALAEGVSTIDNVLVADDAQAMREALVALGARIEGDDDESARVAVTGTGSADLG